MDLQNLTDNFAIPGVLEFTETASGLIRANISTPACTGELYLQGAHLTAWQPAGHEPVIFMSSRAILAPGKAIRGGVPVIFPWFGARKPNAASERTDGPQHGFARTSAWQVAFAAVSGDDLHLTLTLSPSDISRSFGIDGFQVAYQLTLGRELRMKLTVANQSGQPFPFEEALHTYFVVSDIEHISVAGLGGAEYLDKTDGFTRKRQPDAPITFAAETDRLYLNTTATCIVEDPGLNRRIVVEKSNSHNTIVWNPWAKLAAELPDMGNDDWHRMVCVETANASDDSLTLSPQQAHAMEAHIRIEASGS